ncbi:MAG: hypothetical protein BGO14_09480 [Chlamydiales bacterium 38-26]|nr:hypothetical protein [Chlamydiales bacterium]OJV11205.1 MAG: hypothetical protein BGO14_09480 [Chlamydiales bacterium 38-26]
MENRIKAICQFTDHYWYPEIKNHLDYLLEYPSPYVKLDLETLYFKRAFSLANFIQTLVYKVFHDIKWTFSKKYRDSFSRSVKVLIYSEKREENKKIAKQKVAVRLELQKAHQELKEKTENAAKIIVRSFRDYRKKTLEIQEKEKVRVQQIQEKEEDVKRSEESKIIVQKALEIIQNLQTEASALASPPPKARNSKNSPTPKEKIKHLHELIKNNSLFSTPFIEELDRFEIRIPSIGEEKDRLEKELEQCDLKISDAKNEILRLQAQKV